MRAAAVASVRFAAAKHCQALLLYRCTGQSTSYNVIHCYHFDQASTVLPLKAGRIHSMFIDSLWKFRDRKRC